MALPKAARVDVQVSSLPEEQHLDEHGAWRALLDIAAAQAVPALRQLARTGRLWAVSPARTVRLVHALQHPLHVPDVLVLGATRLRSSTSAILAGEIRIHAASTDRVDVAASWQEWVDEPRPGEDDAPSRRERTAVALTQQVHLRQDVASEPPAGERAQAARFTEADDLLVLGTGPRSDDVPEFLSAHELHDTKHRRIAYRAVATSRFREYFRPDLVAPPQALTRESEPVWVDVPSSAPPPPPQLLYAVPLFGWERGGEGRTRTTRRRGGGLRLFLSRTWYASGDGELLGAVLWPGSAASCPVPAALDRLVTRWGFDPVWPAAPPPPTPGPQHFTRGVAVGEDLPLLEDPAQRVSVVGHEVEFDAERGLWTCDVELDLGEAYTPFVRLALARYQPSSIAGRAPVGDHAGADRAGHAGAHGLTDRGLGRPAAAQPCRHRPGARRGLADRRGTVPVRQRRRGFRRGAGRCDRRPGPRLAAGRPVGGAGPRPAHPRRARPVQRAGPAA